MEHRIDTPFGSARLNESTGYYRVQSVENGFDNRFLHHLVWENHYNRSIPEGCVIHHINNLKTDNRIQNLICVPKKVHDSFHSRHRSKETIEKIRDTCTKKYARIVKNGNSKNKPRYAILFNGERIRTSTNPLLLKRWFEENYPNEYLYVRRDC